VINEWNDQYSPKKEQTPFRRRMMMLLEEEDGDAEDSLQPSPKKGGATSPSKAKAKAAAEAKKALAKKKKDFDERKVALAENFLKELDDKVTGGQIQKLAESTGGVKIVWSKKLNSTAGRANWKREIIRSKTTTSPTASSNQTSHHHATIELAEKVIDSDTRLINTLAHEYCHLTNFMISNIRNNPHGASFKEWARKCTRAFADHPLYGGGTIEVTTKHSYVISYKYVWCCEGCGLEYGRHSKSIDPAKVRCGGCKGSLKQVKPTPRKTASPQKKKVEGVVAKKEESPVVVDLLGEDDGDVEVVTKDLADVKL
jgi:predicted SprT family Zn-dependent metalloprotease